MAYPSTAASTAALDHLTVPVSRLAEMLLRIRKDPLVCWTEPRRVRYWDQEEEEEEGEEAAAAD